ncbi:MAG TPA: DUF1501 domain-containing protein [Aequorivita sp.]|nr:DUF1501 domain-containing protein [Aequorivita sp.]
MCKNHIFPDKNSSKDEKTIHDQEHSTWSRRSFIQALGLASTGGIMLGHAAVAASKASPLSIALANSENENILVIVRLKGGNDGLNTIVPIYDYATYANLRPTLRHQQNNLINLNADFAIPNFMNGLESVWGDGKMKVVHGVGYPQQNLSHFRSASIWSSTDDINIERTGWWGRYYEYLFPDYLVNPPDVPPAVQIGSVGDLIFEGGDSNYAFSVANNEQLMNVAESGTQHDVVNIPDCVYGDKLLFMRATTNTTYRYSSVINAAYMASNNSATYGDGGLAKQLALVARLIKGGLGTKVYMVTLDGFDTHANQGGDHQGLLQDLSDSIKNFYDDLAATGVDDKVLTMTISEFGRRPYENGSRGTDHGAASPVMLFGAGLDGNGFVGNHPNLNEWDADDNLIPTNDFRDVYASVLTDWFCLDSSLVSTILLNHNYENLSLGFNCETMGTTNFSDSTHFAHVAVYKNDRTYLEIKMTNTANVDIRLFDIMGRQIGSLENKILHPGNYSIDIKEKIKTRLSAGQYIYRISTGGQFYSKSILVR